MASWKKYLAECIGTLVLVLFACGTAAVLGCQKSAADAAYVATALAFGLVIVAMAYSIGGISGCHLNPAVSVAKLVVGHMTVADCIGYVVAQFVGGVAGAAILKAIINESALGLGVNSLYSPDGIAENIAVTFLVEVILTFVFVLVVLGVTAKAENGKLAGLVIGLTLTLVHLFGIYFTGTSVNPARSFGPALFTGGEAFACVWVFLLAPMVGGVLAALAHRFLATDKTAE